jgi:hypothetical protein
VAVLPVKGATAKANAELTAAMREVLSAAGWPVLVQPREDALTIGGKVQLGPQENGLQKIAVAWSVSTSDGRSLGTLEQNNSVPAGALDNGWKKTAPDIANAAAMGIFEIVGKLR